MTPAIDLVAAQRAIDDLDAALTRRFGVDYLTRKVQRLLDLRRADDDDSIDAHRQRHHFDRRLSR